MDCTLCKKPIKDYHPMLNHLAIDESKSADVCPDCVNRFIKWQQSIYATLFPTKAMKKRFGKG